MNIGIIGAGAMGSGIAQVAAQNGNSVKIYDTNATALTKADERLRKTLDKLTKKGKFTAEQSQSILDNITYVQTLETMKDSDLIIEAIIEDLEIKKAVFKQLENITSEDCILATNTSSLFITSIAAACEKPSRVVGIHFFNPAPVMKLVEIIPALQTDENTTKKAKEIIDSWGKLTVLAEDTPGFIVNRVARPFYSEAIEILEAGIADVATIDWAMTEIGGFKMGPFTLMDFIGHDVNYAVTESVFSSFYYADRYRPSFTQKKLVAAGYYGKKSGRGFYDYTENAQNPEPKKDKTLGRYIVNRILAMLINEAADALFVNIASRNDIDTAMTKGVNYPKGLLKWADEIGIDNCVATLNDLFNDHHQQRYACSPLLKKMSRSGQTFY